MIIRKINPKNPEPEIIKEAAVVLKNGGIVVHPTDTCYGLAANIYDQQAINKVFEIKGRGQHKPLIVAVKDINQLIEIAELNKTGSILFQKFFPGALTLVTNKKSRISDLVTGGLPKVGVRTPNHPVVLQLLNSCDFPFCTTSANMSGEKNPYNVSEINLPGVDLILDAGELPITPPSTVVDVLEDGPVVLRAGPVTREQIQMAVGAVRK